MSTDRLTTESPSPESVAAGAGAPGPRSYPWAPGSATGIGSMPGTDPEQACAVIMGELPDFPFLPELPGRGAGADLIGRTAALLVDLPVETTPGGWKLAARAGRDQRRAASFLAFDLDAAQTAADGYAGPYKISVCGPLTLAASVELSRSVNPALADPGALADLTSSLAEGLAQHVRGVRERIPGAVVVVQVDEPSLPAVLAGHVPTASALNMVRALDEAAVRAALGPVLQATTAATVVHCCAPDYPFLIVADAGADAVSFDLATVGRANLDALAEVADAGLGLLAGALPTDTPAGSKPRPPRDTADAVVTMWRRMTLAPGRLAEQVVVTPACGLAGLSPQLARTALAHCREAARIAPELIEEAR
ncbi:MAG TPA: methionine synthase [Streptosporangiaceae bacterium]